MENIEKVVQLIDFLASNDPRQQQAAAEELDLINKDQSNFVAYLHIITNNINPRAVIFALTSVYRYIVKHTLNPFQEYVPHLKEIMANIIQSNMSDLAKELACDNYSRIANMSGCPELTPFIFSLAQNESLVPFAFRILANSFSCLVDVEAVQGNCLSLFAQFVTSANKVIHLNALLFFNAFLLDIDMELIAEFSFNGESILQILYRTLVLDIQRNDPFLVSHVVNAVTSLMNVQEFYENCYQPFFEFALAFISDQTQHLELRMKVHDLLDIEKYFVNVDVGLLLEKTISLSCEACEIESEPDFYGFSYILISNILNADKSLFARDQLMKNVQKLIALDSATSVQISFFIIDIIIDNYNYYIFDFGDFLLDLFRKCFSMQNYNKLIVSAGVITLAQVALKGAIYLKPIFEYLVEWFMAHCFESEANLFGYFVDLLSRFPEPSQHFFEIYQVALTLSKSPNSNVRVRSIELMIALFTNPPKTENNDYLFKQFDFNSMFQSGETLPEVITLITKLMKLFPNEVKPMVGQIINLFNSENPIFQSNFVLNTNFVRFIIKAVKIFPNSCQQYLEKIKYIIEMISQFDIDAISNDYIRCQSYCFILQALLFATYDNTYTDFIATKIDNELYESEDGSANRALQIVSNKITDVDKYLKNNDRNEDFYNYVISSQTKLILMLRHGFGTSLPDILTTILEDLDQYIEEGSFHMQENLYISADTFDLLNGTIRLSNNIDESFVQRLLFLAEKETVFQGNVILSLSYFATFCHPEFIPQIIQNINKYVTTNNIYLRGYIFKALNLIMFYRFNSIQNDTFLGEISEFVIKIIEGDQRLGVDMKDDYVLSFLLSKCTNIDLVYAKKLFSLLSYKKFDATCNMLCTTLARIYPSASEVLHDEMEKIAIFALTSEDIEWRFVSDEVKQLTKNITANTDNEKLLFYINYDEHKLLLITRRMNEPPVL